jgi:hypothetical protein
MLSSEPNIQGPLIADSDYRALAGPVYRRRRVAVALVIACSAMLAAAYMSTTQPEASIVTFDYTQVPSTQVIRDPWEKDELLALADQATIKNIDYLASGYNIFKGNPNSEESSDPGFTAGQIFELSYTEGRTTGD